MTQQELNKLRRGDIVLNRVSGDSYVIEHSLGKDGHIAIRTIHVTQPKEWELFIPPPKT